MSFVVPKTNMVQQDVIWTVKHTRDMSSFVQIQTLVFGSNNFLSKWKGHIRDGISDLEKLFPLLSWGDDNVLFHMTRAFRTFIVTL